MCSIAEDENLKPQAKDRSPTSKLCVKCGAPAVLIIRIHDPFCKECFQVYVVHRFRAAIGKSKLIRDGEHVLVAYSGGANSSALLNLVQDGLSERAHKKLRFIPTLLHVDERCILQLSDSQKQDLTTKVFQLMNNSEFTAYTIALEECLVFDRNVKAASSTVSKLLRPVGKDALITPNESINTVLQERLKSLIQGLSSTSGQEDFIRSLKSQLMVIVARHLGITKILTAESSTRLAIRNLSDIAQGRGGQVSLNGGFSDFRNEQVAFIRPVRDLNSKELTMYNQLFKVESVSFPCLTTMASFGSSIERLTEHFVTGLQADYQSTVSNIVRTSEKLGLPDLTTAKCILCQSPLDTDTGDGATALDAIEFSLKLSQANGGKMNASESAGSCGEQKDSSCCGQGDGSCHINSTQEINLDDIMDYLCYGCRLSLRSFKGKIPSLPDFVTQEAEYCHQRNKLREEIAEFLLEDEDDS